MSIIHILNCIEVDTRVSFPQEKQYSTSLRMQYHLSWVIDNLVSADNTIQYMFYYYMTSTPTANQNTTYIRMRAIPHAKLHVRLTRLIHVQYHISQINA